MRAGLPVMRGIDNPMQGIYLEANLAKNTKKREKNEKKTKKRQKRQIKDLKDLNKQQQKTEITIYGNNQKMQNLQFSNTIPPIN